MLTKEQLQSRIEQAKTFNIPAQEHSTVEVSISSETAKKLGFDTLECTLDTPLYRKEVKKGSGLKNVMDGFFILNNGMPVFSTIEEAQEVFKALMPDKNGLIEVLRAKATTEYQNKVRMFLNAPEASKKAEKDALKASMIQDLSKQLADGELTVAEYTMKMTAIALS